MATIVEALQAATNELHQNAAQYFAMAQTVSQQLDTKKAEIDAKIAAMAVTTPQQVTVGAGGTYATLPAAWNAIASKQIQGLLTIKLADGQYDFPGGLILAHQPWASYIRIVGNEANPDNCVLNLMPDAQGKALGLIVANCRGINFSGFRTTSPGRTLGFELKNFSAVSFGQGTMKFDNLNAAIYMTESSLDAPNLTFTETNIGLSLERARITAPNLVFNGRGKALGDRYTNAGIAIGDKGSVIAPNATVRNAVTGIGAYNGSMFYGEAPLVEDCYYGAIAENGSNINAFWAGGAAPRPTVRRCDAGFFSNIGGRIISADSRAEQCVKAFVADNAGYLDVRRSGSTGATVRGYSAQNASIVIATETQANQVGNAVDYELANSTMSSTGALIFRS